MIHIHCCCLNEAKFRFFQLMSLTRKRIEDPVAGARMSGRLEAETPQAGSHVLVSYSQAGILLPQDGKSSKHADAFSALYPCV